MKTPYLLLIMLTVIIFLGFGLRPVEADYTSGISIQSVKVEPSMLKVGDTFTITTTLVNNSTVPIILDGGTCVPVRYETVAFFNVILDDHAKIKAQNLACAGVGLSKILDPRKSITGTSPDSTLAYIATKSGTANVTVSFSYYVKNQTDPTQPNIRQTISKSFLFIIYDNKTSTQTSPRGGPSFTFNKISPLKQFKSGVLAKDVQCKQDLQLIIKADASGTPVCVKPQTAQTLVERGWGTILSQKNKPVLTTRSDASNSFAFSLFSNLVKQDQNNVFFSPYSISDLFSMVYEGARGNTADEIQSVFHFIPDDTTRRNYAKTIDSELNNPHQEYKLDTANALWVQNDLPLLKNYVDMLQNYYSANATNLDFKNNSEGSRQIINHRVENKTNQKIKDLLPSGLITVQTRSILTNAIYFKGNWTNQFDGSETRDENFTTAEKKIVKIPMMTTLSNFKYFSDNDIQALEMPYKGGHLSMIVLLPKENDLRPFVESLSVEKLHQWKDKLAPEEVNVHMPKFTLDTKYTLNDNLASMGMPSAFSPDAADFTGITGKKDLFISMVVHQAFVKVDEKGTEAAAATAGIFQTTATPLSKYTFRADHPFVFLIYDDQTGLILFMGQVLNPSR
jgi:serpin B